MLECKHKAIISPHLRDAMCYKDLMEVQGEEAT